MHVESVNIGRAAEMRIGARTIVTGIDKKPVAEAHVHRLGVDGDTIGDPEHHGGPDQAVYVYSREDYAYWEAELGTPFAGGAFGENVTVTTFGPGPLRIGDRYRFPDVVLEVTSPRIPCSTFATHLGERDWVRRFAAAGRLGVYCRVIDEGMLRVGDPVELHPAPTGAPTIYDLESAFYDSTTAEDAIQRLLDAPIDQRSRAIFVERLERAARQAMRL